MTKALWLLIVLNYSAGRPLDFDGVNDTLSTDYAPSSNIQTTAYWVKLDSLTTSYTLGGFVGSSDQFGLYYWGANANKNFGFNTWNGDSYGVTLPDFVDDYFHVVAEYNFTDFTQSKLFVNGQELGISQTHGTTQQRTTENRTFKIDSPSSSTDEMNGKISGVKVFDVALTAAQVADLYNNPEKVVPTGVDNTALKLWLPMQEGAGTTAYDGAADLTDYVTNGDFSDGTNNWTASTATLSVEGGALKVTSTGGNRPQGSQTITGLTIGRKYLLSAVARVGTTSYNMEIEISGIGASGSYNKTSNSTDTYIYYEFTASSTTHIVQAKIDDSNVPAGETGFFDDIKLLDLGNYGTISGATWTHGIGAPVSQTSVIDWNKWYLDHTNEVLIPQGLTSGRDLLGNLFENVRKQGALNLDGNSWAEVHDNASVDLTTGLTLEAWVYWNPTSSSFGILGKYDTTTDKRAYLLFKSTTTKATFNISENGTGTSAGVNSVDLTSDEWYHIVGTYDGANVRIYTNGIESNSTPSSVTLNTTDTNLDIGRFNNDNEYPDQLAQPRIYNRALTAEEVQRNYNAGKNIYTN